MRKILFLSILLMLITYLVPTNPVKAKIVKSHPRQILKPVTPGTPGTSINAVNPSKLVEPLQSQQKNKSPSVIRSSVTQIQR